MPTYARGVARQIVLAEETTYGSQAPGPGTLLRRTNFSMDLQVQAIESQEILVDGQMIDARQGPQLLQGQLAGQLSPGSYTMPFAGLLRGTWTAGVTQAAISNSIMTIGAAPSLGSASTDFLAKGFKKGDVIRLGGLVAPAAAVNGINLRVTNVLQHALTLAPNPVLVAWSTGQAGVTIAVVGKKLITPLYALQIYHSYSIEDYANDISDSDLGLGIRMVQASVNIPAAGFTTVGLTFSGLTKTDPVAQVYPTPTAASAASSVTGVNGKVGYNGADIAYITAANVNIAAVAQPVQAVGNKIALDIMVGMISARGTISALSTGDTMNADFLNENEVDITLYLTSGGGNNPDFVNFYMGRVKLMAATKQDSPTAIMRNYNFTALRQVNGGAGKAWDDTTIVLQDSLA